MANKNSKSPFANPTVPQRIPFQAETPNPLPEPDIGPALAPEPEYVAGEEIDGAPVTAANRKPLGQRTPRLAAASRPGYYRRWMNDIRDRLQLASQAGYAFVKDAQGKNIERAGGYYEGNGFKTYLMELPMKWRNEDLEVRQDRSDELDETIYKGAYKQEAGDKRYVPESGISIQSGTGPGRG